MLWTLFWSLVVGVVIIATTWAVIRWTYRNDFELGAQAYLNGLPMNSGWSPRMREGWAAEWAAQRGANDLGREIGKVWP